MKPKGILTLHDLFLIKGGGERLVHSLCQGFSSDLVSGSISKDSFDLSGLPGKVIDLNGLSGLPGVKTWSLARAFRRYQSDTPYQSAIYSGVASPLAIGGVKADQHVFYCHTPPRFIYDKYEHYSEQLSWPGKQALKVLNAWFKPQYEQAIKQMDVVLTNSNYVKQRIEDCLQLEAKVVYPPCDTTKFLWQGQGDYYLSLARLDGLKRVDAIVEAFKRMPEKKLVVASGGPDCTQLKLAASGCDNIQFTGWLSDQQLLDLLGNCIATIYVPVDEDFGMTPVESMAAGKPVICSDHGGPLESVIDGKTGRFVGGNDLVSEIMQAVAFLSPKQALAMKSACESRAAEFDTQLFIENISKYLS